MNSNSSSSTEAPHGLQSLVGQLIQQVEQERIVQEQHAQQAPPLVPQQLIVHQGTGSHPYVVVQHAPHFLQQQPNERRRHSRSPSPVRRSRSPQGKLPCKFWSEGKCFFGDECKFWHDYSNPPPIQPSESERIHFHLTKRPAPKIPCKFYALGECKYGKECKFLHEPIGKQFYL
jgi:hypothetical protein